MMDKKVALYIILRILRRFQESRFRELWKS